MCQDWELFEVAVCHFKRWGNKHEANLRNRSNNVRVDMTMKVSMLY